MSLVDIRDNAGRGMTIVQHEELLLPLLWTDPSKKLNEIKDFTYKEGDVFICSYPKTGSHWINALVSKLLKHNDLENTPTGHLPNIDMLPTDSIESGSPPRVISTHLTYKYLPIQHRQRQAKIILMLRNPKDVAVSFYHFATKEANIFYDGSLENFITLFLTGKVPYNSYFDWLNEWNTIIKEDMHNDILVVYYEDLKKDCIGQLRRITDYLNIPSVNEEQLRAVNNRCSHANLKAEAEQQITPFYLVDKDGYSTIYRKGVVGDWKNHFTVADNEIFDQVIAKSLTNCSFSFRYT